MTPLPMTVISGYLGAGKTTLINQLLAEDHGLKLMILVNDFGAINIDAELLASRDEDTIALTNGCVCCTMGADLFLALADALDRSPRPDHLIVEASGVADPARIANAALAEPDMRYAGIVTVVDGPAFPALREDPLIGPQVAQQITRADLVWVSKQPSGEPLPEVGDLTAAPVLSNQSAITLLDLVAKDPPTSTTAPTPHAAHIAWSASGHIAATGHALRAALDARPKGLFRIKGFVTDSNAETWQVQVVGQQIDMRPCASVAKPMLVGIGLAALVQQEEIDAWWATASGAVKV